MKPLCIISCPIDTFSGYGARSRDFVNALIKIKGEKWNIKILPQKWGDTPWNFLSKDDPLGKLLIPNINPNEKPNIWVQITIPNEFHPVGDFNIGVTAGVETDIFPGDWIEGLNRMDLNLVSSEHSRNIALHTTFNKTDKQTNKAIGQIRCEKPVEVLFEGLDLDKYNKIQKPKSTILKDIQEDFCFLYTGGWLQGSIGEDRKNVGLMIKTFLETFNTPSRKKPALILKTNHVNYSIKDREAVIQKINNIKSGIPGSLPNIYLVHGEMTDQEINLLNNDPKVKSFISFTKGEGFGRPLLEGAITGKPTVVSNWSGHIDFMKPDYNILIGGELKKIDPSASNNWLIPDSKWFNINIDIAKRALKDLFKNYKKYLNSSRKQTQYLKENWSLDKMADKLNMLLEKQNISITQPVNLPPSLKKFNEGSKNLPKLKLPKLKKVEA